MARLREHRLFILAASLVGLLVGFHLLGAVAADSSGDEGPDKSGTITIGTGRRLIRNVDYVEYIAPSSAIGADFTGEILLYDYKIPSYPTHVRYLNVYAPIGVVMEPFTVTWVYSGTPMYSWQAN